MNMSLPSVCVVRALGCQRVCALRRRPLTILLSFFRSLSLLFTPFRGYEKKEK